MRRIYYLSLFIILAFISGTLSVCIKQDTEQSPYINNSDLLYTLEEDETYIILIDAYPVIKEMAQIGGLKGEYGHVELVRNNRVFGSRPPTCTEFDLDSLKSLYNGSLYEIRKIEFECDFELAISYYIENIEGKPYDLYNRNCTSLIDSLYFACSGQGIELAPLDIKTLYYSDQRVRAYMDSKNLPMPTDPIWFPDQFTDYGEYVGKGRF